MLTQVRLKSLLEYDPLSGNFMWLTDKGRARAGNVAGTASKSGSGRYYIKIRIDKKYYAGHRLAWLYQTGTWPNKLIDHIDGNGLNNKWLNLRSADHNQNHYNQFLNSNNTSGIKGVSLHKSTGKWRAQFRFEGCMKYLGLFRTIESAQLAVEKARKDLQGDFANNG